jgi:hypothetical protein
VPEVCGGRGNGKLHGSTGIHFAPNLELSISNTLTIAFTAPEDTLRIDT